MGFFVKLSHSHSRSEFAIVRMQNVQVGNCLGQEVVKLRAFNTILSIADSLVSYQF